MSRILWSFLLLFCLFTAGGCTKESQPLLRIDKREIFLPEFRRELSSLRKTLSMLPPEQQKTLLRQTLSQLIDHHLLQSEAQRLGISVPETEIEQELEDLRGDFSTTEYREMLVRSGQSPEQWREKLRVRLLNDKIAAHIAQEEIHISAREIEEYYLQNLKDYRHPEQLLARQILLQSADQAEKLRTRLVNGESFAALAAEHSLSPDSQADGDLGLIDRSQLPPELEQALFDLTPGQISQPIKSPYGVHLFLVEKRLKAGVLSVEEVSDRIRNQLQKKKRADIYQRWLQNLRNNSEIFINWEELDKFVLDRAK